MEESSDRSKFRSLVLSWPAAAVAVVLFQAVLSFGFRPGADLTTCTLIPYFLLLAFATGVASVNAVRRTLGQRPFWVFLAVGYGLWALDQWFWIYYELGLHRKIPDSSIADPALFLHVVPILAALVTRPDLGQISRRRSQITLNFLLVLLFGSSSMPFWSSPFNSYPGTPRSTVCVTTSSISRKTSL